MNDERPRFLATSYSFHVLENQAAGSLVGVVSARDDDGAPYNQLSLSLLPAGSLSDAFSIDPLNGRLLTTRSLDRERQVSSRFVLCIVIKIAAYQTQKGSEIFNVLVSCNRTWAKANIWMTNWNKQRRFSI